MNAEFRGSMVRLHFNRLLKSVSDFHAKDLSSNLGLVIQLTFIIIESKLNL